MNIVVSPEFEQFVNESVESGLYETPSDVVRVALGLLEKRDQARH